MTNPNDTRRPTSLPRCRLARGPAIALAALLLTAAYGVAQERVDPAILGRWVATDGSVLGTQAELGKDYLAIRGQRLRLRFVSPGVMEVAMDGETETLRYSLRGDILTIRDEDETTNWRRVAAPAPAPGPDRSGNPLDGERTSDPTTGPTTGPAAGLAAGPFARSFAGDGMQLELQPAGAADLAGTLTFRGTRYAVRARATGSRLAGSFRTEAGQEFGFAADLSGDQLVLQSGGSTYRLVGAPIARNPLETENPLETNNPLGSGNPRPPVVDDAESVTKPFANQKSGVAARIPASWSLLNEAESGCVLNPGFGQGQRLNVTVSLHCLPLDENLSRMAPEKMLEGEVPAAREGFRQNSGLETFAPENGVQRFTVDGKPAAFVTMRAETRTKQRGYVWFALRIEGNKCLVCNGIFLDGEEANFLPQVRKVFASLSPMSAPQRM